MNPIVKEIMEKYLNKDNKKPEDPPENLEKIICDCGMEITIDKDSKYNHCEYCFQEYFKEGNDR